MAQWAENKQNSQLANNPYVYSLSLAVYCTAWTYYGSIGVAANSGLNYLTIYIGPIIIIPVWSILLLKIIRISRINNVSSIADFISLRYGNSRFLGALITVLCIFGILPYIALQLKAISETFHFITNTNQNNLIFDDATTYIALALAIFISFYGTKYVDASEKRKGIMTAVALESILKLFFFVIVGVYVTYFVFNGFEDIYEQSKKLENFNQLNQIGGFSQGINWFLMCVLSMFAIFLLPRQFHTSVVENTREKHIKTAMWVLPLYLLIFNFFVFPIAWGGNVLFENQNVDADFYSLLIPQLFNNQWITILVFLGGFSAAISMIVISTISLSIMLTNNLIFPYGFIRNIKNEDQALISREIVSVRKFSIFILILLAYFLYRFFVLDLSLVSIGLIAFVIIAQLAPAFFGALFWKRGSNLGAVMSIIVGFIICLFTLLIPYATAHLDFGKNFIENGLFGLWYLKPFALFGLDYLSPITHAFFWSMLCNSFCYVYFSLIKKGNYRERNYAEMYVDINHYISNHENAFVWRGTAYVSDITRILNRFIGAERTERAVKIFRLRNNLTEDVVMADARFIKFSENLLTGFIGTASAKILINTVTKEEKITLKEVLNILEESKENIQQNKQLIETTTELKKLSNELKLANEKLKTKDIQKDEFLNTVTHELRTPITAIRSTSELLHDDPDVPEELRQKFLENIMDEIDRLNRLIDKILDLDKFESGRQKLILTENNIVETIQHAIETILQYIEISQINFKFDFSTKDLLFLHDKERMIQVIHNLLGNAIKFCDKDKGVIILKLEIFETQIELSCFNNGKTIPEYDLEAIFDKFYQSHNQNMKKPIGSGLGLAITKQIIEQHKGKINAYNLSNGVIFKIIMPKNY
jgi:Na+/proline symporter/signal transduction histidine kinase